MIALALAYLRERRLTTALNILLMAIPVAMLVLLLQFSRQVEDNFIAGAQGIDLVVGAKGSPLQLVLSSVYHLDQPTGNIPGSALAELRRHPMVAAAIPLALGDSFAGFRIVGTENAFLDLSKASVATGRPFAAPMEVVMGAEVARQTGAGLGQRFIGTHGLADDDGSQGHDQAPFTVVGVLAPTGKPVDRLILTSLESVWDVHGIGHAEHALAPPGDHAGDAAPDVTAILLTYRSPAAAVQLPSFINRSTALQAASPATESTRLIVLFGGAIEAVRAFGWLLAAAGGLAIFVALYNAVHARIADLALLRVMGAGRAQLFGVVVLEGALTAGVAGLGGLGLAHAFLAVAARLHPAMAEAGIVATRVYPQEGLIVAAAVAIGVVAALLPAWIVRRRTLQPILALS